MELKEIYLFIKESARKILFGGFVFGVVGIFLYYLLPVTYRAEGSIYVSRFPLESIPGDASLYSRVDTRFFSEAEGNYYAQQWALSYTHTVMGLLESVDMRKAALVELNVLVNEKSLRKTKRQISVKKQAPQLMTLSIEGKESKQAQKLWNALVDVTLNKIEVLNEEGNSALTVSEIAEEPVIYVAFRNVYINFIVGFVLGVSGSTFFLALRKYLKE